MKVIPTRWHGFTFRSRLEARWSIFFTEMKIGFQYEPEGFRFTDGTLYLPDFFLPEVRFWAEVKPIEPTSPEVHKAEELVKGSKAHLLWLIGPPDFRDYDAIASDSGDVTHCRYRLDIYEHGRRYFDRERRLFSDPGDEITERRCSPEFFAAIALSRAERFEGVA